MDPERVVGGRANFAARLKGGATLAGRKKWTLPCNAANRA
jgi:hypothetical protein